MKLDPHAPHAAGQRAAHLHLQALEKLQRSLGITGYSRAVFTSSGAEAVQQVYLSVYLHTVRALGKNHMLIPASAGREIYDSVSRLEPLGVYGKIIALDSKGALDLQQLEALISPRTALVSMSVASSLVGAVEPLEKVARICHANGISLHLDITAGWGKIWLDLEALQPDYITLDGPFWGSGALWVRDGVPIEPLIPGSDEQGGLRAGAIDPNLYTELGNYVESARGGLHAFSMEMAEKKAGFKQRLGAAHVFTPEESLPHILAFGFEGVHGELLAFHLDAAGVYLSFGGGTAPPLERLLREMGVSVELAQTALSCDLAHIEVDAADLITEIARSLKGSMGL